MAKVKRFSKEKLIDELWELHAYIVKAHGLHIGSNGCLSGTRQLNEPFSTGIYEDDTIKAINYGDARRIEATIEMIADWGK